MNEQLTGDFRCPHCGSYYCTGKCYFPAQWYYYTTPKVPHKCPVCDGTGLVSRPPGIAGDVTEFSSSSAGPWPCQPCEGKGILWS